MHGLTMFNKYCIVKFAWASIQLDGSTHPCAGAQCAGGVGRNIAEALWRLRGGRALLLTAVGADADGRFLGEIAPGLLLDGCIMNGARTASYAAVMDARGECLLGLGDMAVHNHISIDLVKKHSGVLEAAPLVVLDGNAPQSTVQYVVKRCNQLNKPVFYEPTDRRKAAKPLREGLRIAYASPNLNELRAMAQFIQPNLNLECKDSVEEILHLAKILNHLVECLIVTIGAKGVVIVRNTQCGEYSFSARLYRVDALQSIENVSGAGDCFASGFLHSVLLGLNEPTSVSVGFLTAKAALLSNKTVPSDLVIEASNKEAYYETLV